MPEIIAIAPKTPKLEQKKRVAAYARVSSGKDAMLHSLSAQISYYNDLIQSHGDWLYAGVYADEAKTGTKDNRENFQRLMADCRAGKIDMVITKSISRLARNTVTLLETVRGLKDLGVDVYFEEQNIHSLSADGELMLTILASYAQEESRSASENQKWRIRRNFQDGLPWNGTVLGYRYEGGHFVVQSEEAKVVRRIFADYLDGKSLRSITRSLNSEGVLTRKGNAWTGTKVKKVLQNYAYTGNLLLQTTYRENHLTKIPTSNHGELPMYHAENTHEAIISMSDFNAVQKRLAQTAQELELRPKPQRHPFSSLITCAGCGKHYRRKVTATGAVWICSTYNALGKSACPSKAIPEATLTALWAEVTAVGKITAVTAHNGNTLVFTLADGTSVTKPWQDRSRAESWTEDKKAAAQKAAFKRWRKGAQNV